MNLKSLSAGEMSWRWQPVLLWLYFMEPLFNLISRNYHATNWFAIGSKGMDSLKWVLKPGITESAKGAGDGVAEVRTISYGVFINTIITFFIVAFAIFLVVKTYNHMKERMEKKPEVAAQLRQCLRKRKYC